MIDVVGRTRLWLSLSLSVIAAGFVAVAISWVTLGMPLRLGLDFTGGTLLQLEFSQPVTTQQLRNTLASDDQASSIIQLDKETSQKAVLRMSPLEEAERLKLEKDLREQVGEFRRDRVETIGPTIGQTLLTKGLLALVVAFSLIALYVGLRFQFDYAAFAIAALFHDILITTGIFAILGLAIGVEIDQLFVVALLTIIGFSINDTVVIYDRIRENSRRLLSRKTRFPEVVNISVNETFARSINTSLTSMLALLAIFIFGGDTLRYFSLALLVGFGWGTYSSIFIASTLLVWWRERQSSNNSGGNEIEGNLPPAEFGSESSGS
jgi:preprotein translocase subunit SecF